MAHPTFGTKEENVDYVNRYGVYAVIQIGRAHV